jgi:hypothetical protein
MDVCIYVCVCVYVCILTQEEENLGHWCCFLGQVWMYGCMYICMCVCVCVYTYTRGRETRTFVLLFRAGMYVCMYVYTYARTLVLRHRAGMYVYVHDTYVYQCKRERSVYVCVHTYAYQCSHTHAERAQRRCTVSTMNVHMHTNVYTRRVLCA